MLPLAAMQWCLMCPSCRSSWAASFHACIVYLEQVHFSSGCSGWQAVVLRASRRGSRHAWVHKMHCTVSVRQEGHVWSVCKGLHHDS